MSQAVSTVASRRVTVVIRAYYTSAVQLDKGSFKVHYNYEYEYYIRIHTTENILVRNIEKLNDMWMNKYKALSEKHTRFRGRADQHKHCKHARNR